MADMRVCGGTLSSGCPCMAPASLTYILPEGRRRFRCDICGPRDAAEADEEWRLETTGDPEIARIMEAERTRPVQGSLEI